MAIPNNIRAIARQAYDFALRTGKTLSTVGEYEVAVSLSHNFVAVVKDQENKWVVPVRKTWA